MRKKLNPLLFFALMTVLAFWKILFHREYTLLAGSDIASAYFPWFNAAAYWLKRGVWMLWDPYTYSGRLFMGEPQPGLFYPLNWLFMLLPARGGGMNPSGMEALMILDYLLAGLFFYHLARSLSLTRTGAAIAGMAWAYGGFTVRIYGYINVLSGFVWLPPAFLFFHRALLASAWGERLRRIAASGLFLALCFLPGHHVPAVNAGLFILAYAAFVTLRDWQASRWADKIGTFVSVGLVAVAAFLISAIQWLPSAQWARRVFRWIGDRPPVQWGERIPYSALDTVGSMSPQDVLSLLLPYVSTKFNIYVGITVLFLALVGILFVRKSESRFFALAAAFYLFLSWGRLSAVHGWVSTFVPGIWFLREPFFFLIPFQACLAMLAGWGLDHITESYSKASDAVLRIFIRRSGWTMAVLVIAAGILMVVLRLEREMPMNHPYLRGVGSLGVYLAILGISLFLLQTGRIRPQVFAALLIAIVVVDLSTHLSHDIQRRRPLPGDENFYIGEYWKKPPAAEFLLARRRQEPFRVDDPGGVFPRNYGDTWRLEAAMGHAATALVEYMRFRGRDWSPASNQTALLNVRYFVSRIPVPGMKQEPGFDALVYRNPRAVPRAFAVARYRGFAFDHEMHPWISSPLLSPRESVLLNKADIDRLQPEFLRELHDEEEGIEVRIQETRTASVKEAANMPDEDARRRLYVYRAPWGWSAGDEISLTVKPGKPLDHCYLAVKFIPTGGQISQLTVRRLDPAGAKEIPVELPGLQAGETEPEIPRMAVIDLGALGGGETQLFIMKTEACSANIDSIRISASNPPAGEAHPGEVRVRSFQPNRLELESDLERPAFVVVSDVFYPGWEATVDSRPVPIFKGNFILKTLPVPAGKHEIVLRFRPKPFLAGFAVSLVSLLGLSLFLILGPGSLRPRPADSSETER